MMNVKLQFKAALTWLVILCILTISIYELWKTIDSWNERPIDTFTAEVPKHELPFPSITICPEGVSLWAGVRMFLNKLSFSDEYRDMLPLTYKEFLKRKMSVASYLLHDHHIDDCFEGEKGSIVNKSR